MKPVDIRSDGIVAFHDYPCPVFYDGSESAVFDCQAGVFHPSWRAQALGYKMIKVETFWQRLAFKLFFKD